MEKQKYKFIPTVQEFGSEWYSRYFSDECERRPPTRAEREKMDKEIVALGTIFKDSNMWWQLDGSLNISLRVGDYIGVHRDVDVSVLEKELSKLEKILLAKGYGLFLYKREKKGRKIKRTLRRVEYSDFSASNGWKTKIVAVNEKGEVNFGADLISIDTEVIKRDTKGKLRGWGGIVYPDSWLLGETIDFKGVSIRLSHPARFLFRKIILFRKSDESDLEKALAIGMISQKDVQEVEKTIQPIFNSIKPENLGWRVEPERVKERLIRLRHQAKKKEQSL